MVTIVSGAMAERAKFSAYCIYSDVIPLIIYPVSDHWIWDGGWNFIGIQTLDVASAIAYVALAITIVFHVIKHTMGRRPSDGDEIAGLDISEHGLVRAYAGC